MIMKKLLLFLLLPAFCFGQGDQTIINVPIDDYGNTEKAILHLPDDYFQSPRKYPLLVFLHGIGEAGNNPASIYNSPMAGGPAYYIAHGQFPSSFVNPADHQSYKFIVLSPQNSTNWSTSAWQLDFILTYMLSHYNVDASRLYLTGLSAGGEGVTEYVGKIGTGNIPVTTTHKIAAFMPMSAAIDGNLDPRYARTIVADNVAMWGFGSPLQDILGAYTINLVNEVNAIKPGFAVGTSYFGGHCCWGNYYNPNFRQNGMNMYEWALQFKQGGSVNPPPPPKGPYAIPGQVLAQNYSASGGVAIEPTSDAGGGMDVGPIGHGAYMDYSVNVAAAGEYIASFRVAAVSNGASFQVALANGTVLTTVDVPKTGDLQSWQTATAKVNLPAGSQTIRISSVTGAKWGFNWMQFNQLVTPPPAAQAIPGKILASSYATMSGVATEPTTDAGGGTDVGYIHNGDYMDYSVKVAAAGEYTASFRLASPFAGGSFQVQLANGTVLTTVNAPATGGWQTWQTVTAKVTLPAGLQTIRIRSIIGNWNFNWMQFDQVVPTQPGDHPIPGKILASSYSAMSGVGTQATSDVGGGSNVGWIDGGDWMDYAVNVATAGKYTVSFRVSSFRAGSFELLSNGAVLTRVSFPGTGGWQNWQTVTAIVTLAAGRQTLRVLNSGGINYNLNWMQFAQDASGSTSTKIEAENYSSMYKVTTETTYDAGGGLDVQMNVWGGWTEYIVTAPTTGQYTLSLRVASPYTGAALQVWANGNNLATVKIPNTGGWQRWQTISATITLPAGRQTMRVTSITGYGFNLNWLEIARATTTTAVSGAATGKSAVFMNTDSTTTSTGNEFTIFPNPVHDMLNLRVNNDQTGNMLVQITDAFGAVRGTYNFSKTAGFTQVSVATANLTPGVYFVLIQVGNKRDVKKIVKL